MTQQPFSPEVKPEIVFVFELVRDVVAGKLRIPNFQRRYVWRRSQMIDLLDSIRRRYPIGNLLVWDTDERLVSRPNIGHIRVPEAGDGIASHVLDGHQRLSTLAGTLTIPSDSDPVLEDEDPNRWQVWYNAKDELFEHLRPEEKPNAWHFPLYKLMDTIAFLDECERIRREGGEDGDSYVMKVQELLRAFTEYKLPIVRIRNTALTQAVDIFARLNSKGQPMSADQMVSALMYKEDSNGQRDLNIAEVIDNLLEMLDGYGFGHLNRTIVLRALLACLKEDIYRTDWTRLTDKKRSDLQQRLPEIIEPTMAAMERAALFCNSIGVYNDRLLPYSTQLVVLTAFFLNCKQPGPEQTAFLRRWFWVSSYTGWFASSSTTRVGHLVTEMRDKVSQQTAPHTLEFMRMDEPAQPFPKSFNMNSARARTWLLVLLNLKPRNNQGKQLVEPWKSVAEHGPNAVGYIAATVQDKELKSSPANRILKIKFKDRSQAWNWLSDLDDTVRDEVFESHGIPLTAGRYLSSGDRDAFIKARQEHLIQLELDHMKKHDINFPLDSTPLAAPIDTE